MSLLLSGVAICISDNLYQSFTYSSFSTAVTRNIPQKPEKRKTKYAKSHDNFTVRPRKRTYMSYMWYIIYIYIYDKYIYYNILYVIFVIYIYIYVYIYVI